MYCTQKKVGCATKPILLVMFTTIVLVVVLSVIFAIKTPSLKHINLKSILEETSIQFTFLENYLFVGLVRSTPVVYKNGQLYTYNFEDRTFAKIIKIKDYQHYQTSSDYIIIFENHGGGTPHGIYEYHNKLLLFNINGELVIEKEMKFSNATVHDNYLYFIKYNEINNKNEDISVIEKYRIRNNELRLETTFSLPLEVIPRIINNKLLFETVSYREPLIYYPESSIEYSQYTKENMCFINNNKLCSISHQQNSHLINCPEYTQSISINPVAISQYLDTMHILVDSSKEGIHWYSTDISNIDSNIEIIEFNIPFIPFEFICQENLCVVWNQETAMIIYKEY